MADRFVITGTGRCGTKYVATLLQVLGIHVRHEGVWTMTNPTKPDWQDKWGEVGWEAAPHLDEHVGPVIRLIRNPIDSINSRMNSGWFQPELHNNPHYRKLHDYVDSILNLQERFENPLDRAVAHWIEWNDMIPADETFRIEDAGPHWLSDLTYRVGHGRSDHWVEFALASVPAGMNRHSSERLVTWDVVKREADPFLVAGLIEATKEYGYDVA